MYSAEELRSSLFFLLCLFVFILIYLLYMCNSFNKIFVTGTRRPTRQAARELDGKQQ